MSGLLQKKHKKHFCWMSQRTNGEMSGLGAKNSKDNLKTTMLFSAGSASTSGYKLSASDSSGNVYKIENVGSSLSGNVNGISSKVTVRNQSISNGVATTYDFYDKDRTTVLFSVIRNITKKTNPTDSNAEIYDFSFKIENKSADNMEFNIELGLDIETATIENGIPVGNHNDRPQFLDSSQNLIENSVKYDSSSMPDYIYMFDIRNPYLNIQALYKGSGINSNPSYVKLGRYGSVWDSGFVSGADISNSDTMYSVGWDKISVSANGTSASYNTMYGVSDPRKNTILKDVLPKKETITITETVEQMTELSIQCGANTGQLVQLTVYDCKPATLGLEDIPVMDSQSATQSISILDNAQEIIASYRSHEGAMYNRLKHAYAADTLTSENLQGSESRIRDADMAGEMVGFSAKQIIEQAAQSVLAQANNSPQGILALLG